MHYTIRQSLTEPSSILNARFSIFPSRSDTHERLLKVDVLRMSALHNKTEFDRTLIYFQRQVLNLPKSYRWLSRIEDPVNMKVLAMLLGEGHLVDGHLEVGPV